MSVARTGALPNSYKFYTIAVNRFDNRRMEGLVFHESREGAAAFKSLTQLASVLNRLFDENRYPMKSVDERSFQRKQAENCAEEVAFTAVDIPQPVSGQLATFRLHVKFRYYATWQGSITHQETGTVYPFESFMELMRIFNRVLGQPLAAPDPLGKRMCEVAVCNYRNNTIAGEVSNPAVKDRFVFENEFELMEHLEMMLGRRPADSEDSLVVTPRQGSVCRGAIGPMTFLVRVLFWKNGTWQGTACWKEKGEHASFRSFLELLLMMDSAVRRYSLQRETKSAQEVTA
ncbi:MAG: hypothetical protein KH230_18735 [Enterocloster asparagiformis]|nr:hypothetical protein [Enterocloster asparagiformis]